MSNKGYYSWIHTLKSAAMDSRNKGIEMINEEKARKITDPAKQAAMAKKLAAPTPSPEVLNPEDGLPVKPTADIRDVAAAISGLGETSPGTIAMGRNTDVGAYVDIRRTKHKEALETLAKARGPVSLKPAGNANEVEADAQDGVMADPESFTIPSASHIPDEPVSRVHPEPYYSSPEEAHAAVKQLNQYYNQPDGDEDENLSFPTANWRTVKESVSDKINRFFGA
jgi:hypothetical protein